MSLYIRKVDDDDDEDDEDDDARHVLVTGLFMEGLIENFSGTGRNNTVEVSGRSKKATRKGPWLLSVCGH